MMTTSDWELVALIVTPIVIAIVGAAHWITKKVTAVETALKIEVKNLDKRLNRAEDDIRIVNDRLYERSLQYTDKLRQAIKSEGQGQD